MWRRAELQRSLSLPAIAALGCSALYALYFLNRGWLPFDDGMLAHAAQRVLAGELPHRDFNDVYTGGLTWLNAGALLIAGDRLPSLRLVLLAWFLVWVLVVQYIATRFVRPWPAAL